MKEKEFNQTTTITQEQVQQRIELGFEFMGSALVPKNENEYLFVHKNKLVFGETFKNEQDFRQRFKESAELQAQWEFFKVESYVEAILTYNPRIAKMIHEIAKTGKPIKGLHEVLQGTNNHK